MYNNLYSKDPFGVFNKSNSNSDNTHFPNQYNSHYYPFPKKSESTSIWKTIGMCLLIVGFGAILYFKDILVGSFKKMIAKVNTKVNPDVATDKIAESKKPEPKLLTETIERKVECILHIKDKAKWDIQYINKKKEERKAIFTEGLGWTIYE